MVNIYIGNIPFSANEDEVRDLFAQYGTVNRVSLISDRATGRPRGFGFVEMPNDEEGQAAIEALNGHEMDGRALQVNEARPRTESGGGGRGRGGGFRGGGRREYR